MRLRQAPCWWRSEERSGFFVCFVFVLSCTGRCWGGSVVIVQQLICVLAGGNVRHVAVWGGQTPGWDASLWNASHIPKPWLYIPPPDKPINV